LLTDASGSDRCPHRRHLRSSGPLRPPARCLAVGRPGSGRRCGKLGQVVQRVGEMLRAERRELEVLPDELRHRRPVVGECDLSLGRTERHQVVTPDPATELQMTVALLLPRQPANGARRVEHLDLVGHLVVTVWMVGVIHVHPENLPHLGQRRPVDSFLIPAGAIDRRMDRRVRQHREHPRGGHGDSQGGAHVLLGHGVHAPFISSRASRRRGRGTFPTCRPRGEAELIGRVGGTRTRATATPTQSRCALIEPASGHSALVSPLRTFVHGTCPIWPSLHGARDTVALLWSLAACSTAEAHPHVVLPHDPQVARDTPRTGHRCPNMFRGADGGAGGFTLDGLGARFITGIEAGPSNVMGISLPLVRRLLTEVGVMVTDLWKTGLGSVPCRYQTTQTRNCPPTPTRSAWSPPSGWPSTWVNPGSWWSSPTRTCCSTTPATSPARSRSTGTPS